MPEILTGIAAIEERGLQYRIFRKSSLYSRGIYPAAHLPLQITVAADMVCVGMGI